MKTDLEQRLRNGLREYADEVPVVAPPLSAITTAAATRNPRRFLGLPLPLIGQPTDPGRGIDRPASAARTRQVQGLGGNRPAPAVDVRPGPGRRFVMPALAGAAVLTIVAALLVMLPLALPRADRSAGAGDVPARLPARFAGFSFLTGDLAAAPIDRALAVYVQRNNAIEDFYMDWQTLLLDADGSRYRRTRAVEFRPAANPRPISTVPYRPGVLSPDGRRVAFSGGPASGRRELAVLEVATGAVVRRIPPSGADLRPVAWSPDGRLIAYVPATLISEDGSLDLLDVETGEFIGIPGIGAVREAAFSPDGSQIAVQVESEILVIDHAGRVQRRLPLDDGLHLSGPAAWSPDGGLLAVIRYGTGSLDIDGTRPQVQAITFVDAHGGPAAVPVEVSITEGTLLQGWRSSTAIVIWDRGQLVAVSLDGGTRTPLSHTGAEVVDLQLASGMLATMTVAQDSAVDRGPWPGWGRTILGVGLSILALPVVALAIWRLRRRWRR